MTRLIRGDRLTVEQQAEVLQIFVYRWTRDNPHRTRVYRCSLCDIRTPYENTKSAEGHPHPTIPLISDKEWLQQYCFHVTKEGRISQHRRHAVPASSVEIAGQEG